LKGGITLFAKKKIRMKIALLCSGKSVKQIYEHLKATEQDVGTYHSFQTLCCRAGLRQRDKVRLAMRYR
jgi:hypothetical protein